MSRLQLLYGLHLLSVATGLLVMLTGTRTFLFALPSAAAVIVNYAWRAPVRGSWLEAHSDFQRHVFFWALFWGTMASLAFGSFIIILTAIPLFEIAFVVIGIWFTWVMVAGWRALRAGRPAPVRAVVRNA